jgi:NAD(P)-dependent dehydrogenase (short-subunit alcohol dehydrogenase family)
LPADVDMRHEDWRWVIDGPWGPIHVSRRSWRMVEQGQGGHVLFTASFAGLVPNVGLGPYCVAKYGVVALAEVLQRELRPSGIGVSVLCPMRVDTGIFVSERNRAAEYGAPTDAANVPEPAVDDRAAGRILDVDDVARMTVDAIVADATLPHERFARDPH